MAATAIPMEKNKGRPRSRQTNKAILKAAAEIVIASGLAEMTIEGVAERAGVGKASIYRRWPTKGALAFEAVVDAILAAEPTPDTGSLERDLGRVAESWVRLSNARRGGRTLAHFIAEIQSDGDLAVAWRERFVNRIRKERRPIIERAIARGEIPAGSDPELKAFATKTLPTLEGHLKMVRSLQTIGASARDVISILQAMKSAGALEAEIEVL